MRLPLMLATVAAATGLALAVPALADPPPGPVPDDPAADAHFLDTLNQAGMTFRNGPDAVAAGRMACNMMISGRSETDVINELAMRNPGLNSGGAMKFAALASSTYCPDYLSKSSVHTTQPLIPGLGGNR
ncbi:MAG TPA: DUF732 domain-containing protein [Mycobacterium sp.]|nr:DUF732 domain-containing protein [Mycobacterium sp.]